MFFEIPQNLILLGRTLAGGSDQLLLRGGGSRWVALGEAQQAEPIGFGGLGDSVARLRCLAARARGQTAPQIPHERVGDREGRLGAPR